MNVLWALLLGTTSALAFEYGLEANKINEKVYCFFGKPEVMNETNNGNMVNSCYADTGHHWIVVDPGPTYAYAKEAYEKMQRIKQMPVAMVVDTHVHDDHWLGNGFFKAKGVDIFGGSLFKTEVNPDAKTRMQKRISKKAYAGTVVTLPTHYVDTIYRTAVDGEPVQLMALSHTAHTAEDLLVYLPNMQTLFAGDLVFNDRIPSLRDGDINGWIAALAKIRKMPLRTIVGGHGNAVDRHAVNLTYDYLVSLRNAVKNAIDEGVDIEDATRTIQLPAFSGIALYDMMHAQNVEAAYRTLEWEDE